MDILRVTTIIIFAAGLLTVHGCGKDVDRKKKFALDEEILNLTQADTMLSGSADEAVDFADNSQQPVMDMTVDVSSQTQGAAGPVLGDTPDEQAIQAALKDLGLYAGEIDGKVGPKTRAAIKEFQHQNGLVVDGKVGPRTWAALKKVMASKVQTQL